MISIAIIDDNRLVRDGIAALLNQQPDLRVVAGESSGDTLGLRDVNPQVILLDRGLPSSESVRVTEMVGKEFPDAKIIVMDLLPLDEDVAEFVSAGVWGFIVKNASLAEVVDIIRSVAKGVRVPAPQITASLFSLIVKDAVTRGGPAALYSVRMTHREREVIDLIGEGLSNREIAGRLHMAPHTVKSHVRNVMEKLMLHTRLQIAAYSHKDPAR